MKPVLIEHPKLTPTMERVRSGRVQLFREKKPKQREFLSLENCEVSLTHPTDKAMYADLIDGAWYWVTGCQECLGKERSSIRSYIECEKHDVCVSCQKPRAEIEDTVWGGLSGWTCNPCKEADRLERMREAYEKLGGMEPDTTWCDDIICPHCGTVQYDDGTYEGGDRECDICLGEFVLELEMSVTYSTHVKGERILAPS